MIVRDPVSGGSWAWPNMYQAARVIKGNRTSANPQASKALQAPYRWSEYFAMNQTQTGLRVVRTVKEEK